MFFCILLAFGAIADLAPLVASAAVRPVSRFTHVQVARVDRLLRLIQQRLDTAPAMAEARWRTMARIEDNASETLLIDAAKKHATAVGLDAELATRFAQAQIEAGKIIQAERHKQWAVRPDAAPQRLKVADPLRASTAEPELGLPMLKAYRDALEVIRRHGGRSLLDARAADLIHVGGADLLAAQVALRPLYEIAN